MPWAGVAGFALGYPIIAFGPYMLVLILLVVLVYCIRALLGGLLR